MARLAIRPRPSNRRARNSAATAFPRRDTCKVASSLGLSENRENRALVNPPSGDSLIVPAISTPSEVSWNPRTSRPLSTSASVKLALAATPGLLLQPTCGRLMRARDRSIS